MKIPKGTTQILLETVYKESTRRCLMDVKDMDCIAGVPGTVVFLKKDVELGRFEFDGKWPIEDKDNAKKNK